MVARLRSSWNHVGGQYLKGCMESLLPGQAASLHQDLQGYCRGGALGRQFNSHPRRIILWICFLGLTWKLTTTKKLLFDSSGSQKSELRASADSF